MTDVADLRFRVDASQIDAADKKLDKLGKTASDVKGQGEKLKGAFEGLKGMSEPFQSASGAAGGFADKLGGVTRALGGISANPLLAIATAAIAAQAAISAIASEMRAAADEADEMSQKMGISISQLEKLKLVAAENGGTVEGLRKVYDKLSKSMTKFDEDNEKTAQAFKVLQVGVEDLANMTEEAIAGKLVQQWEDLGRSQKATAAIMQVLGPAFRDQIPAIKAAADAGDDYLDRVRKFGSEATPALVKAGGDQEVALGNLGLAWKGLGNEIASSAGNMMKNVATWAAEMINKVRLVMKEWREGNAAMAARNGVISSEQNGDLVKQARKNVYNGSNPNATEGDVNKELQRLRSGVMNESFRKSEAAGYGATNDFLTEQKRLVAQKAASDATPLGVTKEKGGKKGKSDAERESERLAKEQLALKQKLFDLEEKEGDILAKIKDTEGERSILAREIDKIQDKILGKTAEQKQLDKDRILASFDEAKSLKERKKLEEDIAKLKEKQAETTDALVRKSNEDIAKQREQFGNRFMSRENREAAEKERNATGGFDAEIARIQSELRNDPKMGDAKRKQSNDTIADLKSKAEEARLAVRALNDEAKAAESSWEEGLARGVNSYLDSIPSKAQTIADAVNNVGKSMEDAFVNLATTGKLNIKSLAVAVLQEIARMQAKAAVSGIMKLIGGAFSGGASTGTATGADLDYMSLNYQANGGVWSRGVQMFANGGVVSRATPFGMAGGGMGVMGEAGPEAIMPLKRGADGKLGIAGANSSKGGEINSNIALTFNVSGGSDPEETARKTNEYAMKQVKGLIRQELIDARRRGNALNPN